MSRPRPDVSHLTENIRPEDIKPEDYYRSCSDVLDEGIRQLIELARHNKMSENEIDVVLYKILAEQSENDDDTYILEQLTQARADLARDQLRLL